MIEGWERVHRPVQVQNAASENADTLQDELDEARSFAHSMPPPRSPESTIQGNYKMVDGEGDCAAVSDEQLCEIGEFLDARYPGRGKEVPPCWANKLA